MKELMIAATMTAVASMAYVASAAAQAAEEKAGDDEFLQTLQAEPAPAADPATPGKSEAAATSPGSGSDASPSAAQEPAGSEFAATHPALLPANIRASAFIARLREEVPRVAAHADAIKAALASRPEFIALCHWNANIDNAWFWRRPRGGLECGLMDWGCVSQMNVAMAIWGALCGAETSRCRTWPGPEPARPAYPRQRDRADPVAHADGVPQPLGNRRLPAQSRPGSGVGR